MTRVALRDTPAPQLHQHGCMCISGSESMCISGCGFTEEGQHG